MRCTTVLKQTTQIGAVVDHGLSASVMRAAMTAEGEPLTFSAQRPLRLQPVPASRQNLAGHRIADSFGRVRVLAMGTPSRMPDCGSGEGNCTCTIPVHQGRDSLHAMSTATSRASPAGISRENRTLLERLHRELPSAFDAANASRVLDLELDETHKLLGYLARRGWLSRVRRGLYIPVPLDARRSGQWVEDPWIIADRVFRPCYIGGWSACEHWNLTEQVFRTVLVVTAKKVREREPVIQGMPFLLTVRSNDKLFGTTAVWRNQVRVQVSDPSRTIIDILDDPTLGGGMRNVADVIHEYLTSEHRNDSLLVEYGDRLGNRAMFKRLGYILEQVETDAVELLDACRSRRSSGLIALDPSVDTKGTIVRRWGLRANVTLGAPGGDW